MRKYALFLTSVFMSVCAWAQEVKVTHNLPASASAGESIDAQFTVTKGNIGAFAKFQCDVPAGTQAAAGDTKSGNFTFENNRIKIVWVSLPGDATFTFSVKITLASNASGSISLAGQFYYLENNVKKEFDIPPHSISLGGGASTTTTPTVTPTETVATTPTVTPTETVATTTTVTPTETVVTTPTVTPTETVAVTPTPTVAPTETVAVTPTPTTTPVTAPKSGITYYVQIAALSTDPGMQYKKYGKMKVVVENGMYKVLIGPYSNMEEARKQRGELTNRGLVGSWVVGYENGVRIKL